MQHVTAQGFQTLTTALQELYTPVPLEAFPSHILTVLARIISADLSAYNTVDTVKRHIDAIFSSPEPRFWEQAVWAQFMHEHPLLNHQQQTGDGSAHAISDFLTARQYQHLTLYNEVYRRMGAKEQIAFSIELSPSCVIAIAFNRSRRIFTEKERTQLNVLQPHVVHAHRQAGIFTQAQQLEALEHTLGQFGCGVITLTLDGRVQRITKQAQRWLQDYFAPLRSTYRGGLPDLVQQWLNSIRCMPFLSVHPSLTVQRPGKMLTIQLMREEAKERLVLWLEEQTDDPQPTAFTPLGLTKRESDILYWVMRGKTNREIATLLDLSPHTVRTRLEDVFAKLGVATRTAAAHRAREAWFAKSVHRNAPLLLRPDAHLPYN